MRKIVILMLVLTLIGGFVLITGCGKKDEVTIKTEEGETATYSQGVSEEDLQAPIYPGAKLDKNSTASMESSGNKGESGWAVAAYLTEDSISKVVAWYKDKLSGEENFTDMSYSGQGEEMGMFTFTSEGKTVTVTIAEDTNNKGKTMISIMTGSGDTGLPQ